MTVAVCDSSAVFMEKFVLEAKKILPAINISVFSSYSELVNADLARFDGVFIATEIDSQSGIDAALEIYLKNPAAEIIFITENCEKYCQRIFDYADRFKPFALLCKPVSRLLLRHVFEMLERITERQNKDIIVRLKDKDYISLKTSDILYVQHNNRVSYIYTLSGGCFSSKQGIAWFEENLPKTFFHCAKSCIVNSARVKSVNGLEIRLSDDSLIWCSRQYRKSFAENFEGCHC